MHRHFEPRIAEKKFGSNIFKLVDKEHDCLKELKAFLREKLNKPRNFRADPTLPMIVETDATKKAIGVKSKD